MQSHIAVYCRVSSKRQDTRSQEPELKRWCDAYADGQAVVWYWDEASGKNMERPGWQKLDANIRAGVISRIVCWRLDRLGRTASGLTRLFDELRERRIGLVSIKEGIDLNTAAGRMMARVLASLAEFENEVRGERIRAGQAAARAQGKRWGGSNPGVRKKITREQQRVIGVPSLLSCSITRIAKTVGLSRPTIYDVLATK